MSRLSLSDNDKCARDWFVETTKSLGCELGIDSMVRISSHARNFANLYTRVLIQITNLG